MNKKERSKVQACMDELLVRCPPVVPVEGTVVYQAVDGDSLAEMQTPTKDRDTFRIVIDPKRLEPVDFAQYLVLHEYAHLMDYSPPPLDMTREDHGPHWGIWYARVYQKYFQVR